MCRLVVVFRPTLSTHSMRRLKKLRIDTRTLSARASITFVAFVVGKLIVSSWRIRFGGFLVSGVKNLVS
ncbi:hypothetical protein MLPF_0314 [Mycobacterium lepromatosis]|nr:hypothetical protein MLPF_0314 [Mycobacterium lepromatosis]